MRKLITLYNSTKPYIYLSLKKFTPHESIQAAGVHFFSAFVVSFDTAYRGACIFLKAKDRILSLTHSASEKRLWFSEPEDAGRCLCTRVRMFHTDLWN